MTRYFAFLRALNVGGHTVKMETLRRLFEAAGLAEVETFIASGNVIFHSRIRDASTLERRLEAQLEKALGYEVKTFLRTGAEFATIAGYQPFPVERCRSARAWSIGFLAQPLDAAGKRALREMESDESDLRAHGREIHWLCQVRQSESAIFRLPFEKRIGVPATFRSRTTIGRLATKYRVRGGEEA